MYTVILRYKCTVAHWVSSSEITFSFFLREINSYIFVNWTISLAMFFSFVCFVFVFCLFGVFFVFNDISAFKPSVGVKLIQLVITGV